MARRERRPRGGSPQRKQAQHHSRGNSADPGETHRHARLQQLLRDQLVALVRDDLTDPALDGVRVVAVELTPDCAHARVVYAVEEAGVAEEVVARTTREAFDRAAGFLRSCLASELDRKRTPKLSFAFVGLIRRGADGAGGAEGAEP